MYEFQYQQDFDGHGIIHYMGTNFGTTQMWRNPGLEPPQGTGLLTLKASSLATDSQPLCYVVGQSVVRCVTKPEPDSWMVIELNRGWVRPTAYSLRYVMCGEVVGCEVVWRRGRAGVCRVM